MSLLSPAYKLAMKIRQGPLGESLARAWHRCAPPITITKKLYGVKVCMDLRDSLIWWGSDPGRIQQDEGFDRMLKGVQGSVWDVGCNIGVFSLYAASQGLKVTAFDISPKAVQLLQKSAQANQFKIHTVTRAFAVRSFTYTPPADADTRNQPGETVVDQGPSGSSNHAVQSMTFLEAEQAFGTPSFIKLDVEHAETEFLKSDSFHQWIKSRNIRLLVELHHPDYWNLVWSDVPYTRFTCAHALFNPAKT